jgi:hypothetical protein
VSQGFGQRKRANSIWSLGAGRKYLYPCLVVDHGSKALEVHSIFVTYLELLGLYLLMSKGFLYIFFLFSYASGDYAGMMARRWSWFPLHKPKMP